VLQNHGTVNHGWYFEEVKGAKRKQKKVKSPQGKGISMLAEGL